MKRRIIKKQIRKLENALKYEVGRRIFGWEQAISEERDDIEFGISVFLTGIVADNLCLMRTWPSKDRWIDEIFIRSAVVDEKGTLKIAGYLWWGLLIDIGGRQWREPLVAKIQLSRKTARKLTYSITFGKRGARITIQTCVKRNRHKEAI